MSWLESIIYGFVSGLAEFLPLSDQAHQALLLRLFGMPAREPLRDLLVHLAALAAVVVGCWSVLQRLRREQGLSQRMHRSQHQQLRGVYELRLLKTASVPMALGLLLYAATRAWERNYLLLALFSILGGIFLYIPERLPQGNKDAKVMSALDAIFIGCGAAFSSLTGVSRTGTAFSVATARGAERQHAVNWVLLLSIPALAVLSLLDILGLFSASADTLTFTAFLTYIASAAGAFIGGYIGILTFKSITARSGISVFAYYCWGFALFTVVLYLIA